MNKFINIEPKIIDFQIEKISIDVLHIDLNHSALIKVQTFSNENNFIDSNQFILDGEDYKNWFNDDFLIQYVCNKYGYKII